VIDRTAAHGQGVDVVIVACNSGLLLEDCVARVLMAERCASLTVFDNASEDGWPQRVAKRFSGDDRFTLIPGAHNLGFGSGCNRGAAKGSAPWVLFLNPDCLIEQGTLTDLLAIAESNTGIGLLGADVRDAIGRDEPAARRLAPTPLRLVRDNLRGLGFKGQGVHAQRSADPVQTVDACSGALMLLPRSVFERVGRFDETFFLHGEDLDLCARVRATGLRVAVANAVRVVHRQGGSSGARPVFVAWHKHLGLGRYLLRHHGGSALQRVLIVIGIAAAFLFRGLPRALMSR
jgi:N-acetylglucosaminyl-diphospho-decaprenol L-rhamnosyltransferase